MLSFLNGFMKLLAFFFKRKVYYSAIDVGTFRYLSKKNSGRISGWPGIG